MKIREFIADHLQKRLEAHTCLVVYDPDKRYREIILGMASKDRKVVDASESIILCRERAMDAWLQLADPGGQARQVLVYVPADKPITDEDKYLDPFRIFALGGTEFPFDDGDTYLALCRRAKPDYAQQIEELFRAGTPDFETIDNVGGGKDWPKLRTLLEAESAVEILCALLSPSEAQEKTLSEDKTWLTEFKQFVKSTLGFTAITKSQSFPKLRDELWRFVLFSEFVFDLPGQLPASLAQVPRAADNKKALILSLCQRLRTSEPHQQDYIEMAGKAAVDLELEERMKDVEDLGALDTFAFEERSFLKSFARVALRGELQKAKQIAAGRKSSLWVRNSDRQLLWTIAERAMELLMAANDLESEFAKTNKSLPAIFSFYCERGRQLDTLQRGFEQAVAECFDGMDALEELVSAARKAYSELAEAMQERFVAAVESEGWPASGIARNTEVFGKFLAPVLQDRDKKAALIMVDALRFELAVCLEAALATEHTCDLQGVCAQLPTVTAVGMAALMPEANGNLRLTRKDDSLVPTIKGNPVELPADRLEQVKRVYGDQCAMIDLQELITKKKTKVPDAVRLLLVKTSDIDQMAENNPSKARQLMPRVLNEIVAGVNQLRKLDFDEVIIATDHGFVLLPNQEAGDAVQKPPGNWLQVKDRSLLGSGGGNPSCAVFAKEHVGIEGDFENYAVPRSFGTFSKRVPYFHDGLSLQECVLPVIAVRIAKKAAKSESLKIDMLLSYKGGKVTQITTRRPMIDVCLPQGKLFDQEELEIRIEAVGKDAESKQPRVVGELAACEQASTTTGNLRIRVGQAVKIPLKMDEDFEGSFEIRAIDPETMKMYGEPLKLRTGYM